MKAAKTILILLTALLAMLGTFACSTVDNSPLTPSGNNASAPQADLGPASHSVWGAYSVTFDPATGEFNYTENRDTAAHFNISKFIGPHMKITTKSYNAGTGDLTFDVQLTNPTKYITFDVRGILVPNPWDPVVFINPDDYTKYFDWICEQNVNGFRAFLKSAYKRAFNPGTTNTQTYIVNCPIEFANPLDFDFIITCSYPGNCQDPYEINVTHPKLDAGTIFPAEIKVDVLDHQNDVQEVWVDTWQITGGMTQLTKQGSSNTWSALVWNTAGASPDIYTCKVTADSYYGPLQNYTGGQLYDFIQITVGPY